MILARKGSSRDPDKPILAPASQHAMQVSKVIQMS